MAAALQPVVDHSISKTINVPSSIPKDEVRAIYRRAFDLGLKGCTVFRSDTTRGSVVSGAPPPDGIHCCQPDAEQD
jgi:ribonucleoside-diphosphate reductase alpha chain